MTGSVKLNSAGGGSVTLTTPSTASNLTVTLPSTSGTLLNTGATSFTFAGAGTISATTTLTLNGGAGSNGLVLDASNNVGIGTSSPATKLHVSGAGSTPTLFERTGSNGVYLQLKDASGSSVYLGASNGVFAIQTPGSSYSDKLLIDSSGNLGLGVTPSAWTLFTAIDTPTGSIFAYNGGAGNYQFNFGNNLYYSSSPTSSFKYKISGELASFYKQASGVHSWYTAPSGTAGNAISFTQAMTLDASGNLLVGCTSANYKGSGFTLSSDGATKWLCGPYTSNQNTFYVSAANTYGVYLSSTVVTAWASASDERLKTDLKPIENATQKVLTLRAVTGRFKTDEEGVSRSFLIAQDVQAVLPEAVDSEDPEKLGVRYTETIPLLVAAIKELAAKNSELESRLAALEGK